MDDNLSRRAEDTRINQLAVDVANLKVEMAANTAVTTQVRDILTSFRILAVAAKWTAAVGAGVTFCWHAVEFLRHKLL